MKFSHFSLFFILLISNFTFLIPNSSIAFAIEVGGHLTEDTTWNPENNPYLVIENLYVDSGVTLTILPGTEIKVSGAPCTSWNDYDDNFWLYGGDSIAKMFLIDGRIIAEGTEQDSITFTRIQNDFDYYWGCIYITEQSEMSIFKHCKFEYSAGIGIAVGNIAKGAVSIYNGKGFINNCLFNNNGNGLVTRGNLVKTLEITSSQFSFDNSINNFVENIWGRRHISLITPAEGFKPTLLANNKFIDDRSITASSVYYVDNQNTNCPETNTGFDDEISYFYNNNFNFCDIGINGNNDTSIYIKNNRFIGGYKGIDIDQAYVEICNNYFEECDLDTDLGCYGIISNNIIIGGNVRTSAYLDVFQNIGFNGESGITITYRNESCFNNLSISNQYAFNGAFSDYYNNCIFIDNDELSQNGIHGNPIFRNCIIDFPLEYPLIDGGGNIIVDSLQAQFIFEDIQNGGFHLIDGSLAIDAGFDTLGYYYPFDMDYNHRVWDGDNNGSAIIDIGAYEYGAPAFGGIEGVTYDPISGEPVNYVLIKINNESGEFTFSDSLGDFEYKLPSGVYDVYAERVFYDDAVEYQIEVIDGEFTQIAIPMFETVDVVDQTIPNSSSPISNLTNYPNPFNPETTISFSVTQNSDFVNLEVYNIKGQKVKTLINEKMQSGKHTIIWSGLDSINKPVSSGIYLYKIKVDNQETVNRMLLLK